MPQLHLREPLGGCLFLFLELEQSFFALRDQLARGVGVGSELFGDRLESRLIVGLHSGADVLRRRVGSRGDAREPRLVLSALFQQPLNRRSTLGRSLRQPSPATVALDSLGASRPTAQSGV